jgi:hypothetical protein
LSLSNGKADEPGQIGNEAALNQLSHVPYGFTKLSSAPMFAWMVGFEGKCAVLFILKFFTFYGRICSSNEAGVAQLAAHFTRNEGVAGSNPVTSTIHIVTKTLDIKGFLFFIHDPSRKEIS